MATPPRILVYLLRRDLRLSDNPVFHEISRAFRSEKPPFTHLLPIYVFPAQQVEVSGFLREEDHNGQQPRSPYPAPRSPHGGFWRTGPHRAKFFAQSVWDLRRTLQSVGSGLEIRVGLLEEVVRDVIQHLEGDGNSNGAAPTDSARGEVVGVWMTRDEPAEERREERAVRRVLEDRGKHFKLFEDKKYLIDDSDLPWEHNMSDMPNIFTTFRQKLEPLRDQPHPPVPAPDELPPLPPKDLVAPQSSPFTIPDSLDSILSALLAPIQKQESLGASIPTWPEGAKSVHPFEGGETVGQERVWHLLSSGAMSTYKDTRNGLLGVDFSTKMAAFLSAGCLSARWIHAEMQQFEGVERKDARREQGAQSDSSGRTDGSSPVVVSSTNFSITKKSLSTRNPKEADFKSKYASALGFNGGENEGTKGVRFELLWRDYMRLCARKFGTKLFNLSGFVGDKQKRWRLVDSSVTRSAGELEETKHTLQRFLEGRTGIGLIDASQRELLLTGYASNRARQNVASFLAKHLGIDWRIGAEWYECMLVDYDCASNWGNWQYVAGVGNDPRQGRTFNPVKQALDYDKRGEYVKTWVPELRGIDTAREGRENQQDQEALMGVFQAWRVPDRQKEALGLKGVEWVEKPLVKIPFELKRTGGGPQRGRGRGGGGRGGHGGRGGRGERRAGNWRSGNEDKIRNHEGTV